MDYFIMVYTLYDNIHYKFEDEKNNLYQIPLKRLYVDIFIDAPFSKF